MKLNNMVLIISIFMAWPALADPDLDDPNDPLFQNYNHDTEIEAVSGVDVADPDWNPMDHCKDRHGNKPKKVMGCLRELNLQMKAAQEQGMSFEEFQAFLASSRDSRGLSDAELSDLTRQAKAARPQDYDVDVRSHPREYRMDWKNPRKMRGAFMMCSIFAFTKPNCAKVLRYCYTKWDLIKCDWQGCRSKCTKFNPREFIVTSSDTDRYISYAETKSPSGRVVDPHSASVTNTHDPHPHDPTINDFSHTAEGKVEQALSEQINRDYSDFYFNGGPHGGGWGAPNYKRDVFERDYYTGERPNEAWDRAWRDAWVEPNYEPFVFYTPQPSELKNYEPGMTFQERQAVDRHNRTVWDRYNRMTNDANEAISRRNDALYRREVSRVTPIAQAAWDRANEIMQQEYIAWRGRQPWSQFGYKRNEFDINYNASRSQAFHFAYLGDAPLATIGADDVSGNLQHAQDSANQHSMLNGSVFIQDGCCRP